MTDPFDPYHRATKARIASGLSGPGDAMPADEKRLRSQATAFRGEDPHLERLVGLRAKAEAGNVVAANELAALTPDQRMALGFYLEGKRAAAEVARLDREKGGTPWR